MFRIALGLCCGLLLSAQHAWAGNWEADGSNAVRIEYSRQGRLLGEFRQSSRGQWIEVSAAGQQYNYEETGRDARNIYLFDRSRNMKIQMDVQSHQIWYTQGNAPRRLLYDMWSAYGASVDSPRGNRNACRNAIQGRIAWDYEGNTQWREDNIRELCAGAENSAEPARCFRQALHGGINWGGGTEWEWQNAIALCQGSLDGQETIGCFEDQIDQGYSWQEAIEECAEN